MHTTEWEREYRQKSAGLRTYTLVVRVVHAAETDPD